MSVNFVLTVKKFKPSKKITSVIYFSTREVFKPRDRTTGKTLASTWSASASHNSLKTLLINY